VAYTEQQRDVLRDALASGVLTVQYADKRITYRSVRELREALAVVEAALAGAAGARVRQIRVTTSKGF
jgi:thiamine monophosphate synthase